MLTLSAEDSILVGCFENVAWVRVNGSASHLNSHLVQDFVVKYVNGGGRRIVIDLENCPGMDSTFIGILTGITMSLEDVGGNIEVVNANARNQRSIEKLGLDEVINLDRDGSAWVDERALVAENVTRPLAKSELSKKERTEMILEAHETLVKANADNLCQFYDVMEYLRNDLESPD